MRKGNLLSDDNALPTRESIKLRNSVASVISSLSGLSLDEHVERLDMINVKLFGRAEEKMILEKAYQNMRNAKGKEDKQATLSTLPTKKTPQLILVHGASGTGKSALVETLRSRVIHDDGYFIGGKFDQLRNGDPYSAITCAFADLCDLIFQGPRKDEMIDHIRKELGEKELETLASLVYNLSYLLGMEGRSNNEKGNDSQKSHSWGLRCACCSFLRAVACESHPIVLFLDDLQWADGGSLEFMKAFLTELRSEHVLIIGAFRDTESQCSLITQSLGVDDGSSSLTDIHLSNLELESIINLLADLTKCDVQETVPLARVLLRKTHGNPYHALQFLELIQSKKLIAFSPDSGRWEWDSHRIHQETNVSDNVVDSVVDRVQRLRQSDRKVLLMAAYVGFNFNVDVLEMVLLAECDVKNIMSSVLGSCDEKTSDDEEVSSEKAAILRVLNGAADDGLLEQNSKVSYKFSHDRIQQRLYAMVEEVRDRHILHKRIGTIINGAMRDDGGSSEYVLLAADHLNRVPSTHLDERELIQLVKLNLEAAKVARSASRFLSAVEYTRQGMSRLDRYHRWTGNYALTLDLYSSAAELEFCTGNADRSSKAVEEVLLYGRSAHDKIRAYCTKIGALGSQGRLDEATDVAEVALRHLGERTPKKKGVLGGWKANRALRGKTDEELVSMPFRNDDHQMEGVVRLLCSLTLYSFFQNDSDMVAAASHTMMRKICERGHVPHSPVAFATYSLFLSLMEQHEEANRFATLALKLQRRFRDNRLEARVWALSNSFALHWKAPLAETITALQMATKAGTVCGDVEMSLFARSGALVGAFHSGQSLATLNREMRDCCGDLRDYNLYTIQATLLSVWQTVQNLLGQSENVTMLKGDAMHEREVLIDAELSHNDTALGVMAFMKLYLMCLADEYDGVQQVLLDVRDFRKSIDSYFPSYVVEFVVGLTHSALYAKQGRRRDLVQFRKTMGSMEKKAGLGLVNYDVPLAFLRAEKAGATNKDVDGVQHAYDNTIDDLADTQFVHYRALANDRAAQALTRCGRPDLATNYIKEAFEFYNKWGACARVDSLEAMYPDLMPQPKAKRRF